MITRINYQRIKDLAMHSDVISVWLKHMEKSNITFEDALVEMVVHQNLMINELRTIATNVLTHQPPSPLLMDDVLETIGDAYVPFDVAGWEWNDDVQPLPTDDVFSSGGTTEES